MREWSLTGLEQREEHDSSPGPLSLWEHLPEILDTHIDSDNWQELHGCAWWITRTRVNSDFYECEMPASVDQTQRKEQKGWGDKEVRVQLSRARNSHPGNRARERSEGTRVTTECRTTPTTEGPDTL